MKRSVLSITAGLAMLAATAAQAQGYVGAAAGWAKIDAGCSDIRAEGGTCDNTSTGGKVYGGYKFTSNWAVELVYFDWGKLKAEYVEEAVTGGLRSPLEVSPIFLVDVSAKLRATGFGVGVAYFMPFASNWSGVARLGVARNRGKVTATVSDGEITESDSTSKSEMFPYFGVGIGYHVTPNLAITGEVDFSRVKYGADGDYQKDDVRLISIGLRYAF